MESKPVDVMDSSSFPSSWFIEECFRAARSRGNSNSEVEQIIQDLNPTRFLELLDSFHFTGATYSLSRPSVQDFQFFLTRAEWPGKMDAQLVEELLSHAEHGWEAEILTGEAELAESHYSPIVEVFRDDQPGHNVVARTCRAWCLVWAQAPILSRTSVPYDVERLSATILLWEKVLERWPLESGDTRSALDLQRRLVMLAFGDAQAATLSWPAADPDQQRWEESWMLAGQPDEIDEKDPPGWVEYDSEDEEPFGKDFVRPYLCYVLGMQLIVASNHKQGYRWLEQAIHWLPPNAHETRLELSFLLLEEVAGASAEVNDKVRELKQQIDSIAAELGPVQLAKWTLRLAEVDEQVVLDSEELVQEAKRLLGSIAMAPSPEEAPYDFYEFQSAQGKCLMSQKLWADAALCYRNCLSVAERASQGSRIIGTGIGSGSNMYRDAFLFATMCEARVRLQAGDISDEFIGKLLLESPPLQSSTHVSPSRSLPTRLKSVVSPV